MPFDIDWSHRPMNPVSRCRIHQCERRIFGGRHVPGDTASVDDRYDDEAFPDRRTGTPASTRRAERDVMTARCTCQAVEQDQLSPSPRRRDRQVSDRVQLTEALAGQLQERLDDAERRLRDSEEQMARVADHHAAVVAEHNRKVAELNDAVEDGRRAVADLQGRLDEAVRDRDGARDELRDCIAKLNALKVTSEKELAALLHAEKAKTKADTRMDELAQAKADAEQDNEQLRARVSALEQRNQELEQQVGIAQTQAGEANDKVGRLAGQLAASDKEFEAALAKADRLRTELQSKLDAAAAESSRLAAQLGRADAEKKELAGRLQTAEAERDEAGSKLATAVTTLEDKLSSSEARHQARINEMQAAMLQDQKDLQQRHAADLEQLRISHIQEAQPHVPHRDRQYMYGF